MKFISENKNMKRALSLRINDANEINLLNEPYYFDDLPIEAANRILKTTKKVN